MIRHANARAFLERAESWLAAREIENGMALITARNARLGESRYEKPVYWATIEDNGAIIGCAFRTPPYRLGVTALTDTAIAALLVNVGGVYATLSGVSGPEPTANVVAEAWCRWRGGSATVRFRQRLYSLRVLVPPARPPIGALRLANEADAGLVRDWSAEFVREAAVEHVSTEFFVDLIRARQVYLWDDGQPRCLVAAIKHTPQASAIGVLYTPPEIRRRGYGTATIAALSGRLFQNGAKGCYLYADPDNTAVSRIVGGMGYQRVHDATDIDCS
ncbi:MAG TPA: GNAT family N-acetyltransferase [Gammaproteobacteria bacterium]|nr:GNAT family N-acetyltransferase [Gammaproteobacteria bacterium]